LFRRRNKAKRGKKEEKPKKKNIIMVIKDQQHTHTHKVIFPFDYYTCIHSQREKKQKKPKRIKNKKTKKRIYGGNRKITADDGKIPTDTLVTVNLHGVESVESGDF